MAKKAEVKKDTEVMVEKPVKKETEVKVTPTVTYMGIH